MSRRRCPKGRRRRFCVRWRASSRAVCASWIRWARPSWRAGRRGWRRRRTAGAASEPWMSWIARYHSLMRAALAIRRAGGSAAEGASDRAGVDAAFVADVMAPPDGRLGSWCCGGWRATLACPRGRSPRRCSRCGGRRRTSCEREGLPARPSPSATGERGGGHPSEREAPEVRSLSECRRRLPTVVASGWRRLGPREVRPQPQYARGGLRQLPRERLRIRCRELAVASLADVGGRAARLRDLFGGERSQLRQRGQLVALGRAREHGVGQECPPQHRLQRLDGRRFTRRPDQRDLTAHVGERVEREQRLGDRDRLALQHARAGCRRPSPRCHASARRR